MSESSGASSLRVAEPEKSLPDESLDEPFDAAEETSELDRPGDVSDADEAIMMGRLARWALALELFPQSSLSPGIRDLTIYPFEWSEAPVVEQTFNEGATAADAAALAREFLHDDYAYEARLQWDAWAPQEGSSGLDRWKKVPLPVTVTCFGPRFESTQQEDESDDAAELQLDLGLDSLFLPPEEMESAQKLMESVAGSCFRDNIAQLLQYIRRLEDRLPLARRRLHSGSLSGEDFATRIRVAWRMSGGAS